MDITYRTDDAILEVRPTGPLSEQDFQGLGRELESVISDDRKLNGLLIVTREFPGYESLSDLLAHGEFIGEYRNRVPKVAVRTDSPVGTLLPVIGKLFADAEVEKFDFDQRDEAKRWLLD